jgi:hypothetical protein
MKKAIVSIIVMLICTLGVSATYHMGDTVNFDISITPSCGEGKCTGPIECEWIPEEQCSPSIGCVWEEEELACESDLSDNEGVFIYGGYALKDPEGAIRVQVNPTEQCISPYNAATSFVVDKVGTWKFCSAMYALDVSYADLTCSSTIMDCPMQKCIEVTVDEQCEGDNAEVQSRFLSWLESW